MDKDGKINVLIFPCESNSNELHDALSYCYNVNVYGASSVERHGKYIYCNYYSSLPKITDPEFIDKFNEYLDANRIDVIITTHDTVALFLAEHKNDLHAKLVQPDVFTNKICRSKIATHELFEDCSFSPVRYYTQDAVAFPAFIKPNIGEGAKGASIITEKRELERISFLDYLVCEYLPGKEYTIDCFTDRNGQLAYVSPRTRDRIFGGISAAGHTCNITGEMNEIAKEINNRLSLLGLWYFQLKEDSSGRLKLLEISTRCAGTMCLTRAKGANLPLLSVYAAMGYDVSVNDNGLSVKMDRAFVCRYSYDLDYSDVYIDFDDTITLRGKVNPLAAFFLYQCHNKGIKVHLLTRHLYNIHESLRKYALSENLFCEIIDIQNESSKSNYICAEKSIFIDNMFKERLDVKTKLGIPVFDADAFEFLLDWRV